MLKLLLGTAGTGKTTSLLKQMHARAAAGKRSIYLVPEQSSQAAELLCYETLGERLSPYCVPASFRTLSERIEGAAGGAALPTLTDAGRCIFVRRAIEQLGTQVRYYHRHRHNAAFLVGCAEVIGRFKTAGASCEELYAVTANEAGGERLAELALIFGAYEALLSGKALDPEDRISRSAAKLPCEMVRDVAFFVDDFDSFTAPEYALLRRLIALSEEMTVALCCDGLTDFEGGLGVFSPIKNTAERLIRIAKNEGIAVATPQVAARNLRAEKSGLAAVDALLCGKAAMLSTDGVFFTPAEDVFGECRTVAAKIHQLVRNGARYNEIAVICRDMERYAGILKAEFDARSIPSFADTNTTAEYTAPAAFLRAALELAKNGLASRALLALLKTDLCGIPLASAAALENYVFVWQPKAADWRAAFVLNPAGFGELRDEDAEQLALAEAARSALVPKVEQFLSQMARTDGAGLAKSLYLLLDSFSAPEQLCANAAALRAENPAAAEDALRSWDLAMDALDTMSHLLGQDSVTPAEFDELLLILLRGSEVGNVPRTLDAVTITGADRMRLAGTKYSFVLGLCEGEFPRNVAPAGLLTQGDRDFLERSGIELPGSFENRVLLEQMFFYRALTSASTLLCMSAPSHGGGEIKLLSSDAAVLLRALSPPELCVQNTALYTGIPAALAGLAAQYTDDTPLASSLAAALAKEPCAAPQLEQLAISAQLRRFDVGDTRVMNQLLGERLNLSPSRVERYFSCSYSYFLEYVLHLRARRPAELSPIESGSFVHYILEHALRALGPAFTEQTDAELTALSARLAEDYIAENIPPKAADSVRFGYLVTRIKANTAKLLIFMREEQKQSSFVPEAFELPIAEGEEVAPLTLQTPDGKTVLVRGKVDRVDAMRREGHTYIRVVDYKTGSKDFSLEEVYCGVDLQMLLYLFSICDSRAERFSGAMPAGVLYLLADPAPQTMEREKAATWVPSYRMDGVLLDDEMVLNAMEKDGAGIFIPVKRGANGKLSKRAKVASLAKLGRIKQRIDDLVLEMAVELYDGQVDALPLVKGEKRPCDYCDYRTVCCHENGRRERGIAVKPTVFDEEPATTEG